MKMKKKVLLTILVSIAVIVIGLCAHAIYWNHVVTSWIADPANGKDDKVKRYVTNKWRRPWFRPVSESRQAELVAAAVKHLATAPDDPAAIEAGTVFMAIDAEWNRYGSYQTFPAEVNHAVQTYGGRNIFLHYSADTRRYLDIPGAIKSSRSMRDVIALMATLYGSDVTENISPLQELLNDPAVPPIAKRSVLRKFRTFGILETVIDQPLWEKLKAEMGSYADEFVETMEK